jgi:molybdopterin synthase catalytic subunit
MPDVGIHRKGDVDLPKLFQKLKSDLKGKVGAIACFIGIVRSISKIGERVRYLHYECAEEVTKEFERIATEIERLPGISKVMIHHIIDDLEPGEDAIYVLVAGEHRTEVFSALPQIVDRVKAEAPIWKKEVTETKEYWIHEIE